MKIRDLLKILGPVLDPDGVKRRQEMKTIRAVLKKLKAKERDLLERRLAAGDGADREDLSDKLDVVRAQRVKGVVRLQELRAGLREKSPSQHPSRDIRRFRIE
jgi:DNA-directed RNA polymerase sigma subunit (sigma70/sigma32)